MSRQYWPGDPIEGTIVYCTREDHAPPMFAACLARLAQFHPNAKITHMISNDIADARNKAALQCEGDWIWFIDSDMLFAPETLCRLLAHNVDVVQVLCLKRHPPHEPLMWTRHENPVEPDPMPFGAPGLYEVKCVGAGGTLYRRRVFERVPGPWFEGILGTEDTNFARKIRLAGFKLHTDTSTPVRHLTPMAIYPKYVEGQWCVVYEAMNGQKLMIPFDHATLIAIPPPMTPV